MSSGEEYEDEFETDADYRDREETRDTAEEALGPMIAAHVVQRLCNNARADRKTLGTGAQQASSASFSSSSAEDLQKLRTNLRAVRPPPPSPVSPPPPSLALHDWMFTHVVVRRGAEVEEAAPASLCNVPKRMLLLPPLLGRFAMHAAHHRLHMEAAQRRQGPQSVADALEEAAAMVRASADVISSNTTTLPVDHTAALTSLVRGRTQQSRELFAAAAAMGLSSSPSPVQ